MKTLEVDKTLTKEVACCKSPLPTLRTALSNPWVDPRFCVPLCRLQTTPSTWQPSKCKTKVIERIAKESLHQLLPDIIPGLLQGYDNTESSVRKASVFCLVAIYSVIGEELKPHLAQLTGSKMKLLNLYIKRAQTTTTNSNSSSSSDVSSYS
uniref:TOG domain-containing protein n=1 Tax=Astyanax mexicanus TaxID=7994 RepID=A0A3B1JER2_ASTMX